MSGLRLQENYANRSPALQTYGIQPILQGISFSISAGERIGLVGPNGCCKPASCTS